MVQQYGLGRGLASLIPPKKKQGDAAETSPFHAPASLTSHQGGPASPPASDRPSRDWSSHQGGPASPIHQDGFVAPRINPISISPSASPMHRGADISQATTPSAPVQNNTRNGTAMEAAIEKIVSNPHQPRLHFDEVKLGELAQSIKEHGILQPLVVSQVGEKYELIAGERRFQAAKRIGLRTVPVVVRSVTEQEKLELAIIENIQRHDLNPIEEAKAYLRLLDEFNMQQEAVAKKMGKSRSAVANTLRLLHLPIEIQRAVAEGTISEGHAKALLAIENPEKQRAVFDLIIREELTVRETELKVRSISVKSHVRSAVPLHPEILERTEHLTQILGTKVRIVPLGKGGKIMIEYYSPEDLDGLLKRLEE